MSFTKDVLCLLSVYRLPVLRQECTCTIILNNQFKLVSIRAPDGNNERGFAYICRDGTTRRWMCHGFHAVGNTGERLSHAVGCAFAICLERKQKRDREAAELTAAAAALNNRNSNNNNHHNHNHNSRTTQPLLPPPAVRDPQIFRFTEPPPMKPVINPYAIDRPHATPLMLQRQTSFRPLSNLRSQTPFKRQLSLKLMNAPPSLTR